MLNIALSIILFGLGSALASFYIAQIYRIEEELPFPEFVTKGSFCEGCKKELKWYELIPIISYIFQRGKCGKCGHKISITYPIFELINGLTLVLLFTKDLPIDYYLFSQFLFFLAAYDFYFKGFPKQIMHSFLIVSIVFSVYKFIAQYNFSWLVIAVAMSIVLAIIILNLIKKSFGVGDLLVILMLSLVLTLKEFLGTVFFSIMIAGVFAIGFVLSKKVTKKDTIPFVPFIFLGFLALFMFEPFVDKYFTYLLYLW